MIIDFFLNALLAGIMLAFVAAPLGCFVVWRRMAYFGDAVAHSALLGVVLGISFNIQILLAIVPIAVLMALVLSTLQHGTRFSTDTLLGILAHLGLALGVTALALNPSITVDLMAYLFGDILAVSAQDLMLMYVMAALIVFVLWLRWRQFMLLTVNEDLAAISGINVKANRLLLMLMIAVTVAISIKLVGLLLITSMLILPAATARYYSRSPHQMVFTAIFLAVLDVCGGLYTSFLWDTPSGPSIVLMAGALFIIATLSSMISSAKRRASS